jgi:hypothetical protein
MKKITLLAVFGLLVSNAFAMPEISGKPDSVATMLERIMAKAGISFGGEFRSQFLSSTIGDTGAVKNRRTGETVEFTSVDFDVKARPNTVTQGRAIFRMHQDWRNYFSDISNPIFVRWLSIDGTAKDMVSYNVGNFKQKYTPLTLYAPDVDIMYEPTLFARDRKVAMNEAFLENNQRILQGVNLNGDAEIAPIFNAAHIGLFGARLRNVEIDIQNGAKATAAMEKSPVEKYLIAGNLDLTFLKGISLGGNLMNIFDNRGSSYLNNRLSDAANDSLFKLIAQNTTIIDGRGSADISTLLNADNWKATLSAEFASSKDDSGYTDTVAKKVALTTTDGSALRAGITGGYTAGELLTFSLDAFYINTTSDFRNDAAQSPVFIGRRIMNVENDTPFAVGSSNNFDVTSPHYSSFDALYHNVFKFAPSAATNMWNMAPFSKRSYTNTIFTKSERAKIALDPSLQLVMPFGPATPNRTGIDAKINLGILNNRIQCQGIAASLKEIDSVPLSATVKLPQTSFSQFGGGVKIDVNKFINWPYPFYVSSSIVSSKAENPGLSGDTNFIASSLTSNFYCEDLYFKFWKRAALIGGMELLANETVAKNSSNLSQIYYAGGLEYKVSDGSYVTGTVGKIAVSYENAGAGLSDASVNDFSQTLVNLFLTVKF